MFTIEYLSALPRKDLQACAKQHGFKANKSTAELIQLLAAVEQTNDADDQYVEEPTIPGETTAESAMEVAIEVEMIVVDEKTGMEEEVVEDKDDEMMVEKQTAEAPQTVIPEECAPSSSSSSSSSSNVDETMNMCTTDNAASTTNTTTNEEEMIISEVVMEPLPEEDNDKSSNVRKSTGNPTTATKVKAIKSLTRPATIVPKPNKAAVMRQEAIKKATASSSSSGTGTGPAMKETIAITTKTVVKIPTTASTTINQKSSAQSSTFTAYSGSGNANEKGSKVLLPKSPKTTTGAVFKAKPMPNFKAIHTKLAVARPPTTTGSSTKTGATATSKDDALPPTHPLADAITNENNNNNGVA